MKKMIVLALLVVGVTSFAAVARPMMFREYRDNDTVMQPMMLRGDNIVRGNYCCFY